MNEENSNQTISIADLPLLKTLYKEAVDGGKEIIIYKRDDGTDAVLLTDYAKFVIEFLEREQNDHETH